MAVEVAVPTLRFDVETKLGEGGMGVVYAVWDRHRSQRVALKTLRGLDPKSVVRFKQEFRTVLDLRHPNLVTLGELIETDGRLMFTMELVSGEDFRAFVCGRARGTTDAPALTTVRALDTRARRRSEAPRHALGFDEARLRSALRQLGAALAYMHDADVVHLDVKPSNVLVDAEGRVVLLDFGVAARGASKTSGEVAGTPEYMAPEMLLGRAGKEADLYAVGVMLYEVLTGFPPFEGAPSLVLAQKLARDAVRPSELRPDVPEDLDALCMALLERDPEARPTAHALVAVLENRAARFAPNDGRVRSVVGREQELERLVRTANAKAERPRLVTIEGATGLGKSSLVGALTASFEGTVLEGRCREQEAIPYRAFDGVIDALSNELARDETFRGAVSAHVPSAATMFPALARFAMTDHASARVTELGEARFRAFAAIRQMLATLARRRPLLVFIDDAQWADEDGATLLDALLDADDAPRALFIIAHRPVSTSHPFMSAIRRLEGRVVRVHVALTPLDADASRMILAGAGDVPVDEFETALVAASGNPFVLTELARALASGHRDACSFDAMLAARIAALPEAARSILDTVAVAAYPIDRRVVGLAVGADVAPHVARLTTEALVRCGGARGPDVIEIAHDQIREHLVHAIGVEGRRARHEALARAILDAGLDEPDHLAEHFAEAALAIDAGAFARRAADRAEQALAFDRAARFHLISLCDPSLDDGTRRATRIRLGEALARTGRGRESADAFLAAGQGADEPEWLALRQRAAEELLITGHLEEGLDILRGVLEEVGLDHASNPWTALPSIAIESTRLALRGLEFEVRDASEWPRKLRMRADACLAAARALSIVDTITGAAFQLRALRLALELGDPFRVLYNVALGAGLAAANEGSRGTSADTYLAAAERTAELVTDPRGRAFVLMAQGVVAYCRGHFERIIDAMREGEHWLVTRCVSATWELNIVRIFLSLGLAFRGDLPALARALADYEKDADARSDVYAGGHFRLAARPWLALASGDIEGGRRALRDGIDDFHFEGYSWASFHGNVHLALFALHDGDVWAADEAIKRIDALPGPILLARFRFHRLLARWLKGRTEVSRLSERSDRGAQRKLRGIIDGIFDEGEPWANGLAHSLDAAACRLEGDGTLATVALWAARDAFAKAGMALFEHAASYELSLLLGERDEGPRLRETSVRELESRGVKDPERFAGLLAGIR